MIFTGGDGPTALTNTCSKGMNVCVYQCPPPPPVLYLHESRESICPVGSKVRSKAQQSLTQAGDSFGCQAWQEIRKRRKSVPEKMKRAV